MEIYEKGKRNLFLSHFDRFGTNNEPFLTTTMEMLDQIKLKESCVKKNKKLLLNYKSYKE